MDYGLLTANLVLLAVNAWLFRRKIRSLLLARASTPSVADDVLLATASETVPASDPPPASDSTAPEATSEAASPGHASSGHAEGDVEEVAPPAVDPLLELKIGLVSIVNRLAGELVDGASTETIDVSVPSPFSVVDEDIWIDAVKLWRKHGAPLIATVPDRACPACGGSDHRYLFDSSDSYAFHACEDCGMWFVPKQVDGELFKRYFSACPEGAEIADRIIRQRLTAERETTDRERIGAYLEELLPIVDECSQGGRTYLDVGCGLSRSLQVAEEFGFRAHGIEVDEASVEIARESGLSVSFPGEPLPDESYSLISLWETIEHLDDPQSVLRDALPHLAEGGVIALTFPNLNCPMVRFMRSDCVYVHGGVMTPGHINLFHLQAIERLLDSLGLCVIDADSQYGSNLQEMTLYGLGLHRGTVDFLDPNRGAHPLSKRAMELNNIAGPPLALAERTLLLAPILRIVACRKEDAPRFEEAIRRTRERRAAEIQEQAALM